jgi:hypothetical protein
VFYAQQCFNFANIWAAYFPDPIVIMSHNKTIESIPMGSLVENIPLPKSGPPV